MQTAWFAFNPVHNCADRADRAEQFEGMQEGRDVAGPVRFRYGTPVQARRDATDEELAKLLPNDAVIL